MTEKFTMNGVTDFNPFRNLVERIDEGLESHEFEEHIDEDLSMLSNQEVFTHLPPDVQEAVSELEERLHLDIGSNDGIDLTLQSQTKSAISRAGCRITEVTNEDYETVGFEIQTPSGHKVRTC